jgi:hypothetical protein
MEDAVLAEVRESRAAVVPVDTAVDTDWISARDDSGLEVDLEDVFASATNQSSALKSDDSSKSC